MGVMDALKMVAVAFLAMLRWLLILACVLLAGLLTLVGQMCRFGSLVCGLVAKVAIIAALVVSTLYAAAATFRAYGADLPALIPAALLVVAMTAIGLSRHEWGALLAGGLTALEIGTVVESADLVTRSLIIVGAIATTIVHNQFNRSESNETQEEQQRIRDDHKDRPDLLHHASDSGPGHVHPTPVD